MFKRFLLMLVLGFVPGLVSFAAHSADVAVGQAQTVNINTADAETIAHALVGIGPSRAEAIVSYRDSYGPFFAVEDLLEVRGVGPAVLEKNRGRIALE
jgi:competence protein ComEA